MPQCWPMHLLCIFTITLKSFAADYTGQNPALISWTGQNNESFSFVTYNSIQGLKTALCTNDEGCVEMALVCQLGLLDTAVTLHSQLDFPLILFVNRDEDSAASLSYVSCLDAQCSQFADGKVDLAGDVGYDIAISNELPDEKPALAYYFQDLNEEQDPVISLGIALCTTFNCEKVKTVFDMEVGDVGDLVGSIEVQRSYYDKEPFVTFHVEDDESGGWLTVAKCRNGCLTVNKTYIEQASEYSALVMPDPELSPDGSSLPVLVYVTESYLGIAVAYCHDHLCTSHTSVVFHTFVYPIYSISAIQNGDGQLVICHFDEDQLFVRVCLKGMGPDCGEWLETLVDSSDYYPQYRDLWLKENMKISVRLRGSDDDACWNDRLQQYICPVLSYNVATNEASELRIIFCSNPACTSFVRPPPLDTSLKEYRARYLISPTAMNFVTAITIALLLSLLLGTIGCNYTRKSVPHDISLPFLSDMSLGRRFHKILMGCLAMSVIGLVLALPPWCFFLLDYLQIIDYWPIFVPESCPLLVSLGTAVAERYSSRKGLQLVLILTVASAAAAGAQFLYILGLLGKPCFSGSEVTVPVILIVAGVIVKFGTISTLIFLTARMQRVLSILGPGNGILRQPEGSDVLGWGTSGKKALKNPKAKPRNHWDEPEMEVVEPEEMDEELQEQLGEIGRGKSRATSTSVRRQASVSQSTSEYIGLNDEREDFSKSKSWWAWFRRKGQEDRDRSVNSQASRGTSVRKPSIHEDDVPKPQGRGAWRHIGKSKEERERDAQKELEKKQKEKLRKSKEKERGSRRKNEEEEGVNGYLEINDEDLQPHTQHTLDASWLGTAR